MPAFVAPYISEFFLFSTLFAKTLLEEILKNKDRMAMSVLTQALKDGFLKKGERIIEYTGGSTGSSLAFVSACLGLNFTAIFQMPFQTQKGRLWKHLEQM